MIPYGRQTISDADVEAVVRVLRSDYLTQGPQVPAFEQAVARDGRYFPSVAALARLDLADGKPDTAQARFKALLQLDPKNGAARQALGRSPVIKT